MEDNLILEGKKFISARRASEISGYNSDYLGQLCRGGKLEGKLISRTWFVEEEALRGHLLSSGRKKYGVEKIDTNSVAVRSISSEPEKEFLNEEEKQSLNRVRKEISKKVLSDRKTFDKKIVLNSLGALLVGTFIIVAVLNVRSNFLGNIGMVYQNEKELSSKNDFEKIQNIKSNVVESYILFINKIEIAILNLFNREKYLAKENSNNDKMVIPEFGKKNEEGAVMIPVPKDTADLSKIKDYLKNSFSDEIKIVPDESGSAGVIKPVFSDPKEEEYFYVMVPISN